MSRMRSQLSKIDDYPAYLDKCWQEHLKPKSNNAPTVITTFAGCGGSSLGYSMAGFRELLAVEWNDNAVATFKLNFPDVPVYHGAIANLTVNECLKLANIKPGQLDILDSSPPCQGFSTAGKRQMTDKRNQLYMQFVRLLKGLKPKVFVMENVSGLVKGKMKLIFAEIMRELKASNYKVSCRLLNAKYFGVPQSRERLIFIGVREDLGIEPGHPKAETKEINGSQLLPNKYQHLRFLSWRNQGGIDAYKPKGSVPVGITKKGVDLEGRIILRDIKYVKRFHSFPEKYKFLGTTNQSLKCIGNSVPPLMMRSIAKHIKMALLPQ